MNNNFTLFDDDIKYILSISNEEYKYNQVLFSKIENVMTKMRKVNGLNKTLGLEALNAYEDLNIRVNKLSTEISTVGYNTAMEEMSKGMVAIIAAGIAALIALIWKIISALTGTSSSSSGGGVTKGTLSADALKKINDVNFEISEKVAESIPPIIEESDDIIGIMVQCCIENKLFYKDVSSIASDDSVPDKEKIKEEFELEIYGFSETVVTGDDSSSNSTLLSNDVLNGALRYTKFSTIGYQDILASGNEVSGAFGKMITVIKFFTALYDEIEDSFRTNEDFNKIIRYQYNKFPFKETITLSEGSGAIEIHMEQDMLMIERCFSRLQELANEVTVTDSDNRILSAIEILNKFKEGKTFEDVRKDRELVLSSVDFLEKIINGLDNFKTLLEKVEIPEDKKVQLDVVKKSNYAMSKIRALTIKLATLYHNINNYGDSAEQLVANMIKLVTKINKVYNTKLKLVEKSSNITDQNKDRLVKAIEKNIKDSSTFAESLTNYTNKVGKEYTTDFGNKRTRLLLTSKEAVKHIVTPPALLG